MSRFYALAQRYGGILFDLIVLLFYTTVISLVTVGIGFGMAFTALLYAMDRTFFEKVGTATPNYIEGIKRSYKQGILLGLLSICLISGSVFAISTGFLAALYIVILMEVFLIMTYAFPLITFIKISLREALFKAFLMAHKHVLVSIFMLVSVIVLLSASAIYPPMILLVLPVYAGLVIACALRMVIVKYLDKEDCEELFMFTLSQQEDAAH